MAFLELKGVEKYFGAVHTIRGIDLDLYRGEVLALLGENGAGKTTLMNILYGLYHQDAGEMLVRGQPGSQLFHRSPGRRPGVVAGNVRRRRRKLDASRTDP